MTMATTILSFGTFRPTGADGNAYGVYGQMEPIGFGDIDDVATFEITGLGSNPATRFREGTSPQFADFDGDGVKDLAVGSSANNAIYLFWSAKDLAGKYNANDADIQLSSVDTDEVIGQYLTSGDFNGDGIADLAASAFSTTGSPYGGYLNGRVYVYNADNWRSKSPSSPSAFISSTTNNDGFSTGLIAFDLNNDSFDDLIINALYTTSYEGRTFIVERSK